MVLADILMLRCDESCFIDYTVDSLFLDTVMPRSDPGSIRLMIVNFLDSGLLLCFGRVLASLFQKSNMLKKYAQFIYFIFIPF
jgi:hypothetical protein